MVKLKLLEMKQPELGRKISELRKAKGMTQEELVEKCNLNVRTIQRIEAGEVMPRSYTIKALLEVLGEDCQTDFPVREEDVSPKGQLFIYLGIAAAVLYFIVSYFEITMEIESISGIYAELPSSYALVKLGVLGSYSLFLLGFIKVLDRFPNQFLKVAIWLMLSVNAAWMVVDIAGFFSGSYTLEDYYYFKVSSMGLMYALMGAGFLTYNKLWSHMPQVIGGLGLLTGILLFSVIGAALSLIPMTLFEVGQIAFMIWATNKTGRTSSPGSVMTGSQLPV